jgi:hypothetical protein
MTALAGISGKALSGKGKPSETRQTIDGDKPTKGTGEAWPLGTEATAVEEGGSKAADRALWASV